MYSLGLDLSFSRIPDVGWVERRRAEGIKVIFQCVWTGGYASNEDVRAVAASNLSKIRAGGVIPAVYSNAAPWRTPDLWLSESLTNMGVATQYVKHVMVDVEITAYEEPRYPTPAAVREFIGMWESRGYRVCTYSADWYLGRWVTWLGKAADINFGRPYIPAQYDNSPALVTPRFSMGPLAGKQYRNSHDVEGVTVDSLSVSNDYLNIQEDTLALTPEQEAELAYFLTPRNWGKMKADGTLDGAGPPWFGRQGVSPMRMLVDNVAPWLDSVHLGTIFAQLSKLAGEHGTLAQKDGSLATAVDDLKNMLTTPPTLDGFSNTDLISELTRRLNNG